MKIFLKSFILIPNLSRYKNININVVDRNNNISISDLTYLKTKDRFPSKAWAFKKGDRVLIPITKNGKTINNEKALVNEKYRNKIISLQEKKAEMVLKNLI